MLNSVQNQKRKIISIKCKVDGQKWDAVFTWSEDRSKWATCTGCAPFYSASKTSPNTEMTREYRMLGGGNRIAVYHIYATRTIKAGEALTHTYQLKKKNP